MLRHHCDCSFFSSLWSNTWKKQWGRGYALINQLSTSFIIYLSILVLGLNPRALPHKANIFYWVIFPSLSFLFESGLTSLLIVALKELCFPDWPGKRFNFELQFWRVEPSWHLRQGRNHGSESMRQNSSCHETETKTEVRLG